MIKLAGIWEVGWNTPITEMHLWEMVVREFGVDQLYMTPVSGIANEYVDERMTMQEVLDENQDMTFVFTDAKSENLLSDFLHPHNALYLFGRVGPDPTNLVRPGVDQVINVQTPYSTGLLWPHQIAAIMLYDRFKKSCQ